MKDTTFCCLVIVIMFIFVTVMLYLDEKIPCNPIEEQHKCTNFVRYKEHYQITPMTWYYRDSFKCVECGKDYKESELDESND